MSAKRAHAEIQRLTQAFTTVRHGMVSVGVDRYAAQFGRDLYAIIEKYGVSKDVKTLNNGIRKVSVYDAKGETVSEWHE